MLYWVKSNLKLGFIQAILTCRKYRYEQLMIRYIWEVEDYRMKMSLFPSIITLQGGTAKTYRSQHIDNHLRAILLTVLNLLSLLRAIAQPIDSSCVWRQ